MIPSIARRSEATGRDNGDGSSGRPGGARRPSGLSGWRITAASTIALTGLVVFCQASYAEDVVAARRYSIKPSDVVLPQGAPVGQYRRIIQPFPNWTLICDENLKKKQRTCNITQVIVDETGATTFSWSLAATGAGQPIMILRLPAEVGRGSRAMIRFPNVKQTVTGTAENCDQHVCMVLLPVGPLMRKQITGQSDVQVAYASANSPENAIAINTTFKGLATALSKIK